MNAQSGSNASLTPIQPANGRCEGVGTVDAKKRVVRGLVAPADLLAWVAATPNRQAARALGVDESRVRQLRLGVALRISPALLERWQSHKAELPATPWQLRRVNHGGSVVLAGQRWPLPAGLVPPRAQVLVAQTFQGDLLVRLADGPAIASVGRGA